MSRTRRHVPRVPVSVHVPKAHPNAKYVSAKRSARGRKRRAPKYHTKTGMSHAVRPAGTKRINVKCSHGRRAGKKVEMKTTNSAGGRYSSSHQRQPFPAAARALLHTPYIRAHTRVPAIASICPRGSSLCACTFQPTSRSTVAAVRGARQPPKRKRTSRKARQVMTHKLYDKKTATAKQVKAASRSVSKRQRRKKGQVQAVYLLHASTISGSSPPDSSGEALLNPRTMASKRNAVSRKPSPASRRGFPTLKRG